MKNGAFAMAFLTMLVSFQVSAAGDAAAGKQKAQGCLGCHGKNGVAVIAGYPSLKGQNEQYLVNALHAYKKGNRTGGLAGMMKSQVSNLSDQDIDDIAAYFAQL